MHTPLLPKEDWTGARLAKWPYVAIAIGALALVLAAQDDTQGCTQKVFSAARQIDQSLPSDPSIMEVLFERLSRAADLCEKGRPQQAKKILDTLYVDYRG
jgi:hypothetical protein